MRRPDQIDATLAKHFAWSFVRPGAVADLEERLRAARQVPEEPVPEGDPTPVDEQAGERARERARKACRPLASAIAEAWAIADGEVSARAAKRLLARAERLGYALVGLDERAPSAVRLLRLLVRHGASLTRRQRERAAHLATLLPLDGPELAELLAEVARSGDRAMAAALQADEDWEPDFGGEIEERALAARLAQMIDAGPTHPCRVVAIDVLSLLGAAARSVALPALRRALRLPSFAVRGHALHALAAAEPFAVAEADLVHVLRDLVLYPPPDALADDEHEEDERLLADAVLVALERVQPAEVEETLLDLIDAEHDSMWLDAGWATEALAVAFPETAAVMVDHWLKCARSHQRMRALGALARLPDHLAEPRLTLASSDPAFAVRDIARRQWLDRFPRACPAGPTDVVGAGLLHGPPSERFVSRLGVMQGRVREACRAMARALLAEAPDREAMVLLLQLAGDDAESQEPSFAVRDGDGAWAVTIVRRFGAAGVEGLCALAARFPEPESFGWLRRLGDLVEQGIIAREHAAPLQELAARHVASAEAGRVDDALRVLSLLGTPADLLDRVLSLALEDDPGAPQARGLIVSWPDRTVDARLASEMALALAEHDWPRLEHAAAVGLARGGQGAAVIAGRVLEVVEQDEDAVDAAVECARHLRERGLLRDPWALDALSRPESPLFAVAARVWWRSAAVRGRLEASLASPARGGASAIEAAVALLHGDPPLSPRDRRLSDLLERASPQARAELVYAMCMRGAPFGLVAPYLEALVVSPDPSVTGAMTGVAAWLRSPRARAFLRGLLPRVVDPDLAADIEEALGTSSASFWAEG